MFGNLFGISPEVKSEIQKVKNAIATSNNISHHTYKELKRVYNKPLDYKFFEKYFGDYRHFYIYHYFKEYGFNENMLEVIQDDVYEKIVESLEIIGSSHIREKMKVTLDYIKRKIVKSELLTTYNRVDYEISLLNEPKEKQPELLLNFNIKNTQIKYTEPEQEYDKEKHILNYQYEFEIATNNPELKEQIDEVFARKLVELKYRFGKIDKYEYEKEIATFDKKSWYQFKVVLDEVDPSSWEFDIDYNKYFIELLLEKGYELPQNIIDETPDEELDSMIIEMWFKSTFTSIAAGFLRNDRGHSFRSVVASDPASIIVEEVQIDENSIDESLANDDGFKEFVKNIKKRRSFR